MKEEHIVHPSAPPPLHTSIPSSLSPGTLWVVSTPIGNPDDLSPRAARTLRAVSLVVAEDARLSGPLLARVGAEAAVAGIRSRNGSSTLKALGEVLRAGRSAALVCDSGTPGIADPGEAVVREAIRIGAAVRSVPGPSAVLAALVLCGVPSGRFAFDGFPPRGRSDRVSFFQSLAGETRTLVLYESPRRLRSTLQALASTLGSDRPAILARNLTTDDEAVIRGTLGSLAACTPSSITRGQLTLVIAPPNTSVS
jgi:16S rRNA (cytidine1402-2'-O)-methyltransferase